jgi:hypothetical protein
MPIRGLPNGARNTHPQAGRDRPEWVVAISRKRWSRSIVTGGRNQSERVVAIVRCAHLSDHALYFGEPREAIFLIQNVEECPHDRMSYPRNTYDFTPVPVSGGLHGHRKNVSSDRDLLRPRGAFQLGPSNDRSGLETANRQPHSRRGRPHPPRNLADRHPGRLQSHHIAHVARTLPRAPRGTNLKPG